MSSATILFLFIRVVHVLLAALWLGAMGFVALFLIPAAAETGPASGLVMSALLRRRVPVFMAVLGGTTVLTGFWLYWRFTGGFDPVQAGSMAARVYGTGGVAGILALILGAIVSKNGKRVSELAPRLTSMDEGLERASLAAQMADARGRARTFGLVVLVLQSIALVCMAIGHYV